MKRYKIAERRQVADRVKYLAMASRTRQEFMRLMKLVFRTMKYLDEGCDREVYSLPCRLVLKIEYDDSKYSQNNNEARNAKRYKKIAPRIFCHYISPGWAWETVETGFNIIVAERATWVNFKRLSSHHKEEYYKLDNKFQDVHEQNIGLINNRLVIVDLGLGRWKK